MKRILLLFIFLHTFWVGAQTPILLDSPSKKLKAEIKVNEQNVEINLSAYEKQIVKVKTLQFELDKKIIQGEWILKDYKKSKVNSSWKPVYGERNLIKDCYNQLNIQLTSSVNNKEMKVCIRLYDEGLAFRYHFNNLDFWNQTLKKENTQFLFSQDLITWVSFRAQSAYSKTRLSDIKGCNDRPQVIQLSNNNYVAIGEAALVDYSRMKLKKVSTGFGIESELSGDVKLDLAGYKSPWRYIMVAKTPGGLVENNDLLLNLNEPNQIKNTSWIKPGMVIREVTLTTTGALACVDFASENNIPYVEFDAGWYGNEYDNKSDALTVTVDPERSKGPLDLKKVIDYANQKNVGIILYVNMRALKQQLDVILPLYKKWGIKGLKFGFVDVGDQYSTSWLHQAVRKAAKYELMVDIHDEYRPTGYSRTYPNLLTQEGIRGDEESPALDQTIYTLYNRMICGAGDYTNCYFAKRVSEKMGGLSAQLAKRVAIYSPWQFVFWYDRPNKSPHKEGGAGGIIIDDPITQFYCSIPTVWDESKYFDGKMGEYSIVARRYGKKWYVGVLNAGIKRKVLIPLDKLIKGNTNLLVYQQDGKKKNKVVLKKTKGVPSTPLSLEIEENSGAVIVLDQY